MGPTTLLCVPCSFVGLLALPRLRFPNGPLRRITLFKYVTSSPAEHYASSAKDSATNVCAIRQMSCCNVTEPKRHGPGCATTCKRRWPAKGLTLGAAPKRATHAMTQNVKTATGEIKPISRAFGRGCRMPLVPKTKRTNQQTDASCADNTRMY